MNQKQYCINCLYFRKKLIKNIESLFVLEEPTCVNSMFLVINESPIYGSIARERKLETDSNPNKDFNCSYFEKKGTLKVK